MGYADDKAERLGRGWDAAETIAAQSGNWIKLEPGESVLLNIVSEPDVDKKTFTQPNGEERESLRFSFDVWVPGQGIKVWEISKTTFSDIKRQRNKRSEEFTNAIFSVERVGSGTATKYAIDYERQLKPAEIDERNAALIKAGKAPEELPF